MEAFLLLVLLWASRSEKMKTWARNRAVNLPESTR